MKLCLPLAVAMAIAVVSGPAFAVDPNPTEVWNKPQRPLYVLPSDANGNSADPATSAKQDTTNTDLGAPGSVACATDTGSCNANAFFQRLAQRLTSLIATAPPVILTNADQSVSQPTVCANLLATVPNGTYSVVESQNQSAVDLQFVIDDGSATPGTVTVLIMSAAASAGKQGGSVTERPFKGRARVCGTASSQFALRYQ